MSPKSAYTLEPPPVRFVYGWKIPAATSYCPFHKHSDVEIVYHPRGAGITKTDLGEEITFGPGSVVIYPPDVAHDQRSDEKTEDLCVQFSYVNGQEKGPDRTVVIDSIDDAYAVRELYDLTRGAPLAGEAERTVLSYRVAALLTFLQNYSDADGSKLWQDNASVPVVRAREFMRTHLSDIGSVEEVAESIGVGYDSLRHLFRHELGISLKKWLGEVRLEKAKNLLLHSNLPLKTIADQCGYDNERYFCTVFKRAEGTTPGAYRFGS